MYLTMNDLIVLAGLLSFCAFLTYTTHECACAIRSYLDE